MNLTRCTLPSLRARVGLLLTPVQATQLLAAAKTPRFQIGAALGAIGVDDGRRAQLANRLADTSAAFSLWTVCRTAPDGRDRYRLAVRVDAPGAEHEPPPLAFEW